MLSLFWSAAHNAAAPVEVFPIASPVNEAPATVASIGDLTPLVHGEIVPSRLSKMNCAWDPSSWKSMVEFVVIPGAAGLTCPVGPLESLGAAFHRFATPTTSCAPVDVGGCVSLTV